VQAAGTVGGEQSRVSGGRHRAVTGRQRARIGRRGLGLELRVFGLWRDHALYEFYFTLGDLCQLQWLTPLFVRG
jgi:hypothetical protein